MRWMESRVRMRMHTERSDHVSWLRPVFCIPYLSGIVLPELEWYRLSLSIQKLCDTTENLEQPRFWGKVFGSSADYYIVEAKLSEPIEDEEEEAAGEQRPEPEEGEEEEEEAEQPKSR